MESTKKKKKKKKGKCDIKSWFSNAYDMIIEKVQ